MLCGTAAKKKKGCRIISYEYRYSAHTQLAAAVAAVAAAGS